MLINNKWLIANKLTCQIFAQSSKNDYLWVLKSTRIDMKYYSQYLSHDLFELQDSLSGLSKSNRWVKLADNLPWDKIEKEYNKHLRNRHNGAGNKPARMIVGAFIV